MNRKQIWLTISQAYYCEPEERTEEQDDIACDGLCLASLHIGTIDEDNLLEEFSEDMNLHGEYWFELPNTREHDLIRGDFAYWLSIMSDKEYEELTK